MWMWSNFSTLYFISGLPLCLWVNKRVTLWDSIQIRHRSKKGWRDVVMVMRFFFPQFPIQNLISAAFHSPFCVSLSVCLSITGGSKIRQSHRRSSLKGVNLRMWVWVKESELLWSGQLSLYPQICLFFLSHADSFRQQPKKFLEKGFHFDSVCCEWEKTASTATN